jgi:hypothetical protein
MSGNKVVKSVSFNVKNEQDKAYLERIRDEKFSGYVKRLIDKDIRQRKVIKAEKNPAPTVTIGHTASGPIITKGTTLILKSE